MRGVECKGCRKRVCGDCGKPIRGDEIGELKAKIKSLESELRDEMAAVDRLNHELDLLKEKKKDSSYYKQAIEGLKVENLQRKAQEEADFLDANPIKS